MKTATVLRHLAFEDLGTLAPVLSEYGYAVTYRSVGDVDFLEFDPIEPDLLVVLGGPIGTYQEETYPFLKTEKDRLRARLAQNLPTLGICLGAQLVAAALGSRVYASGIKEIGFSRLTISPTGQLGPLRHLEGIPVLHWHGDTYDLPAGSRHLASSPMVHQQAFAVGDHLLGLQFHPEVDAGPGFERWLVGHATELYAARIDITALRSDAAKHGDTLKRASYLLFDEWLGSVASR